LTRTPARHCKENQDAPEESFHHRQDDFTGSVAGILSVQGNRVRVMATSAIFFGLGGFMAQVAMGLIQQHMSGQSEATVSKFQHYLGQCLVLCAAIGWLAIMFKRYT
jgi:hypothetical protein